MSSPQGVPGPTRVSRSFSSAVSTPVSSAPHTRFRTIGTEEQYPAGRVPVAEPLPFGEPHCPSIQAGEILAEQDEAHGDRAASCILQIFTGGVLPQHFLGHAAMT